MQTDKYVISSNVKGSGSYGCVLEGHLKNDPAVKLAFKFLRVTDGHGLLPHTQTRDIMALVSLEKIMAERPDLGGGDIFVDFPIIPLLDIINGSDVQLLDPHPPIDYVPYSLILVFPFCPCDLHSFLHSGNLINYSWDRFLHLCFLLVRSVAILHSVGWSHRDIKPSNALVSGDGQLLLCDFGMARCEIPFFGRFGHKGCYNHSTKRYLRNKMTDVGSINCKVPTIPQLELLNGNTAICGTVWWRAPEQCFGLNKHYSGFVGDSWSLGCSICDLIFDVPLFKTIHRDDLKATGEVLALINYLNPLVNCTKYHAGFLDTSKHQMRAELFNVYKQTIRALNSDELIEKLFALRSKNDKLKCVDDEDTTSSPNKHLQDRDPSIRARSLSLTVAYEKHKSERIKAVRQTLGPLVAERTPEGINSISESIRLARLVMRNMLLLSGKYWRRKIYYTTSSYSIRELLFFSLLIRFSSTTGLETLRTSSLQLGHYKDLLILLELNEDVVVEMRTLAALLEKMLNIDPDGRTLPTIVMNSPIFKALLGSTGIDIHDLKDNKRSVQLEKYKFLQNLRCLVSFDMSTLLTISIITVIEKVSVPILQNFIWDYCSVE